MTNNQKNEGEGNRTAAREYNKDTREFIETGKVGKRAEKARKAVENDKSGSLERAEEKGRKRARR